jgi:hypothetical protein
VNEEYCSFSMLKILQTHVPQSYSIYDYEHGNTECGSQSDNGTGRENCLEYRTKPVSGNVDRDFGPDPVAELANWVKYNVSCGL